LSTVYTVSVADLQCFTFFVGQNFSTYFIKKKRSWLPPKCGSSLHTVICTDLQKIAKILHELARQDNYSSVFNFLHKDRGKFSV
jgi:hypothetical protein